jgi:Fe2+ or Zn2+ uptake regulation protein
MRVRGANGIKYENLSEDILNAVDNQSNTLKITTKLQEKYPTLRFPTVLQRLTELKSEGKVNCLELGNKNIQRIWQKS